MDCSRFRAWNTGAGGDCAVRSGASTIWNGSDEIADAQSSLRGQVSLQHFWRNCSCIPCLGNTEYYRHVIFDNSLTSDAYFSRGLANGSSSLELKNGLLPVRYGRELPHRLVWKSFGQILR